MLLFIFIPVKAGVPHALPHLRFRFRLAFLFLDFRVPVFFSFEFLQCIIFIFVFVFVRGDVAFTFKQLSPILRLWVSVFHLPQPQCTRIAPLPLALSVHIPVTFARTFPKLLPHLGLLRRDSIFFVPRLGGGAGAGRELAARWELVLLAFVAIVRQARGGELGTVGASFASVLHLEIGSLSLLLCSVAYEPRAPISIGKSHLYLHPTTSARARAPLPPARLLPAVLQPHNAPPRDRGPRVCGERRFDEKGGRDACGERAWGEG